MRDEAEPGADARTARSRRQVLAAGTALVGGSFAGRAMATETGGENTPTQGPPQGPPDVPRWMKEPGADVGS